MHTTSNDGQARIASPKRNLTRALIPLIALITAEAAFANSIPITSDGALGALAPTGSVAQPDVGGSGWHPTARRGTISLVSETADPQIDPRIALVTSVTRAVLRG